MKIYIECDSCPKYWFLDSYDLNENGEPTYKCCELRLCQQCWEDHQEEMHDRLKQSSETQNHPGL